MYFISIVGYSGPKVYRYRYAENLQDLEYIVSKNLNVEYKLFVTSCRSRGREIPSFNEFVNYHTRLNRNGERVLYSMKILEVFKDDKPKKIKVVLTSLEEHNGEYKIGLGL
jgi:hypothetical protein